MNHANSLLISFSEQVSLIWKEVAINKIEMEENQFIADLKEIVNSSRGMAYSAVNYAQVRQNWLIGQRIVIQEQNGETRAEYGKRVVEMASKTLTTTFGKGFSERSLWKFKQFYLLFSDIQILPTLSAESNIAGNQKGQVLPAQLLPRLSWSHYERI